MELENVKFISRKPYNILHNLLCNPKQSNKFHRWTQNGVHDVHNFEKYLKLANSEAKEQRSHEAC